MDRTSSLVVVQPVRSAASRGRRSIAAGLFMATVSTARSAGSIHEHGRLTWPRVVRRLGRPMRRPYRQPGLELRPRSGPPDPLAKALQEDLRSLGYLRAGIGGQFGAGTASAVRALQYDLLTAGQHGSDGNAPVGLPE